MSKYSCAEPFAAPVSCAAASRNVGGNSFNFSPGVARYLEPFTKEGWPKGSNPENARDRARQEQALYATKEKGERLITVATGYIAGRVQQMVDATGKGTPWPPKA